MSKPILAISLGDPRGIGPEITLRALSDTALQSRAIFWICGDPDLLHAEALRLGIEPFWWDGLKGRGESPDDYPVRVYGQSARLAKLPPGPAADSGRASAEWVRDAIALAKGEIADMPRADAIVTAPISKEAWHAAGITYPGHTELLAESFASPRSAMLFVGKRLRVILVTIHVPLKSVPALITREKVFDAIDLGHRACLQLGVKSPRIAVAGLNPHAGEHRLFGNEDEDAIAPAIAQARAAGIDATGPHPGDAVFLAAADGKHDLVVAMYHDQGLIPVKLLERKDAVNVTTGLSWQGGGRAIIRTSPAPGTAFDIAGKSPADEHSMHAAIDLAIALAHSPLSPRERGRG